MKPISLHLLLQHLGISTSAPDVLVAGFAIDSRLVEPGDLFFALPGNRVAGEQFLQEVASKGGVAAFVAENYQGENFGLSLVSVPNVLDVLQALAKKMLAKRRSQVIAITGSLGKTTAKEFTRQLLQTSYHVDASLRSYNTQSTLPLTILKADEEAEILLLEMGMSEPGNIEKLVDIAPPDIAVLTTTAVQHADLFPDGLQGITREKATIFSHPKTRLGLFHHEIAHFHEVKNRGSCQKQTFSLETKEADYFLEWKEGRIALYERGVLGLEIPSPFTFKPFIQNFLIAVSIARIFEVSWEAIRGQASALKAPSMRFERVEKKGVVFINDAYNANPDAMKAALESLPKPASGGKTIAVLSEMNALGMYSEGGHSLVAETALQYVDLLLCLGDRCQTMQKIWKREKREALLFKTRQEITVKLQEIAKPGDIVLLKGARAYALEHLLNEF